MADIVVHSFKWCNICWFIASSPSEYRPSSRKLYECKFYTITIPVGEGTTDEDDATTEEDITTEDDTTTEDDRSSEEDTTEEDLDKWQELIVQRTLIV